ncbi:hypothetical protein [uncultured Chryseobacterium sp.]|uniref:hypothetical protein n=1 Tax=uncultured Chryseobacterium sp. TaxID=259322 RepID=UPI0025DE141E|nr:hypothetical protein [uncultured Chryseobacterium sp.]
MSIIKKSHKVILDRKDKKPKEVEQSVSIDTKDKWITVSHDAGEMTMSMENWFRLLELYKKAEDEM